MKVKIVIIGNGKLASGFVTDLVNYDNENFIKYVTSFNDFLAKALRKEEFCKYLSTPGKYKTPLIAKRTASFIAPV